MQINNPGTSASLRAELKTACYYLRHRAHVKNTKIPGDDMPCEELRLSEEIDISVLLVEEDQGIDELRSVGDG